MCSIWAQIYPQTPIIYSEKHAPCQPGWTKDKNLSSQFLSGFPGQGLSEENLYSRHQVEGSLGLLMWPHSSRDITGSCWFGHDEFSPHRMCLRLCRDFAISN